MAKLATFFLAALLAGAADGAAQPADPATTLPLLYPEIILETDESFSADVGLSSFRAALIEASKTRVLDDWRRVLDPQAVLPFMADEVEFFIGQKRTASREEFLSLGFHTARRALEMAGRVSKASVSADPLVQARFGMYVFANLAAEPTVGRTPWLDGRICTANYGRISWPDWVALDQKLRFIDRGRWVVATLVVREGAERPLPAGWPKRWQMVPVAPEQKRSGGSLGIIAPDGKDYFFATHFGDNSSHFAPYLNSHLCFERQEEVWKVSAIALRLD